MEDKVVAERLPEIWENFARIVKFWGKCLCKLNWPAFKIYEIVTTAAEDLLTPAKLKFGSFHARLLLPFLEMYQTDKPMIRYTCQE